MAQISRLAVFGYMIGMLLFGTSITILSKLMDEEGFAHPYFQCATMFLGEFFCFGMYGLLQYKEKRKQAENSNIAVQTRLSQQPRTGLYGKLGKFVFCIPAFFDMCASTLMFIGLVLSAASIYQMIRGFIIVVVAVYSVIFLKRSLYRHQITGVAFALVGVSLVGLSAVLYSSKSAENPFLGLIILIIAQFLASGVFVSEELFLGNVKIDPLQIVGIEGLSGLSFYIILLPILNIIPCDNSDLCSKGYIEDSLNAFYQIGNDWIIMLCWWGVMISFSFFNWTGVSTTKYANALARSTVDTSRTLLVWLFSMLVGWETFNFLQLGGFILLVIGTALYNEVLVLPFWGFKESVENHQRELEERQRRTEAFLGRNLDDIGITPKRDDDIRTTAEP